MTNHVSDFTEVEEVISLLVNVLGSVEKLPHGAERDAALKKIEGFQKQIGIILMERGLSF